MSRFANISTSYGIDSTLNIDLIIRRDDGRFWDLGTKEDRERLEQMQQEHQTELLIGNAPCISFRTLLYPSRTKTQTDRVQDQERQYTRACIEAYKRQLIMGRHFLHEHPVHASSWCMPEMRELMNDGRVHLVQGPMCHWRLSSTGFLFLFLFLWECGMGGRVGEDSIFKWRSNSKKKLKKKDIV